MILKRLISKPINLSTCNPITCTTTTLPFSLSTNLQLKLAAVLAAELALVWRWFGAAVVLYNGAKLLLAISLVVLLCRAPLKTRVARDLALLSVWLLTLLSLTFVSRDLWNDLIVCRVSSSYPYFLVVISVLDFDVDLDSNLYRIGFDRHAPITVAACSIRFTGQYSYTRTNIMSFSICSVSGE